MNLQLPPPINASPSKEFFIKMIVRDVQASHAISELVDNSVDGAKRLRPDGNFTGLEIALTLNEESFKIIDNCGGISVEIAQNYAFRFGRTEEMPEELKTKRPIGQFGVGMKRALFKLGNIFTVESVSHNSSFVVEVDVEKWKHEKIEAKHKDKESSGTEESNAQIEMEISESVENWTFDFKKYGIDENNLPERCGTNITVTELDKSVAADFKLKNFQTSLSLSISAQQSEILEKGLVIKINGIALRSEREKLVQTENFKPIHIHRRFPSEAGDEDLNKVDVNIYAGVSSKADKSSAGWSVYCNSRLVLNADKTSVTGWGIEKELLEEAESDAENSDVESNLLPETPNPHQQYHRFRGFVYFESDNAELLPWNTSKTGINIEAPIYRSVRVDMIRALRQIIDFLNLVKNEAESGEARYNTLLKNSIEVIVSDTIPAATNFYYVPPDKLEKQPPKTQKISFSKSYDAVERAKDLLNVRTTKEVGEQIFDYFMLREDSEDV